MWTIEPSRIPGLFTAEVQARWLRFASGCPYGNSDDGCCGHSENVTPECTLWACPLTMERLDADLTAAETMFMNAGAECTWLRKKWVASEQEVLALSAEVEALRATVEAVEPQIRAEWYDGVSEYVCPWCERMAEIGYGLSDIAHAPDCLRQVGLGLNKEQDSVSDHHRE